MSSKEDIDLLKRMLTEHGYQTTKVRRICFELLQSPQPQTMREVLVKAKGRVDRVSVYRAVEVFEKSGIVQRIYIGWKYKLELADVFTGHHHHLSCLSCGRVIDIGDESHIDDFIRSVSNQYGFHPRRHQFEIDGECQGCREAAILSKKGT